MRTNDAVLAKNMIRSGAFRKLLATLLYGLFLTRREASGNASKPDRCRDVTAVDNDPRIYLP